MLFPSFTINTIIEDYQEIHAISQSHLLFKLNEKLVSLRLSEADIDSVIDTFKKGGSFQGLLYPETPNISQEKNCF